MKFLIFSDLHTFQSKSLEKIQNDFDFLIFLGDIPSSAILTIMERFPEKLAYGVLGNHDDRSVFDSANRILSEKSRIKRVQDIQRIQDIHLQRIERKGISFTGLEGSIRYSDDKIGFTQKEALSLTIPSADILFSHETGFRYIKEDSKRKSHEGFRAISNYIKKEKPRYHFFGHHHRNCSFQAYSTKCFGVYGCVLFNTDNDFLCAYF